MSDSLGAGPAKRFRYALIIFGLVVAAGTVGYEIIEGWSLLESAYMTLITISTVGFREVHPLSAAGRVFTMFLLLGGVGAATYTAFTAVEALVEKEMRLLIRGERMDATITKMRNHVIICGHGRVGRLIAAEFVRRRVPFVVVEREPDNVAGLTGVPVIQGDATEDSTLEAAGITRARSLICALASDADNVFIALTAHELNPQIQITARSDSEGMEQKLLRAGAHRVVSPYHAGALRMAVTTLQPNVVDFMNIVAGGGQQTGLRLEELEVEEGSEFVGRSLSEIEFRQRFGLMVVAIKRTEHEAIFSPGANEKINAGDILLLIGPTEKLEQVATAAAGSATG
jgi:voltage-gated potassium channel